MHKGQFLKLFVCGLTHFYRSNTFFTHMTIYMPLIWDSLSNMFSYANDNMTNDWWAFYRIFIINTEGIEGSSSIHFDRKSIVNRFYFPSTADRMSCLRKCTSCTVYFCNTCSHSRQWTKLKVYHSGSPWVLRSWVFSSLWMTIIIHSYVLCAHFNALSLVIDDPQILSIMLCLKDFLFMSLQIPLFQ